MSPAIADRVVDHVESALRSGSFRGVGITWFGGEPLLSVSTIESIQSRVNAICVREGLSSSRSLITNGYLLTESVARRLMALGKWDLVQITIDGTPMVHDSRRPLVSGKGTYDRVVRNSLSALELGLPVTVRVNVDSKNSGGDAIRASIDSFQAAGAHALVPTMYLGTIIDSTPECSHMHDSKLSSRNAARARMILTRELLRLGFPARMSLPAPKCTLCIADSPEGVVVAPSGLLFKCWNEIHLGPEQAVGTLNPAHRLNHVVVGDNRLRWASYDPFSEQKNECRECKALPSCMGGCPWEAVREPAGHGDCGVLKFFPDELIKVAHADRVISALTGSSSGVIEGDGV
jgi:uncharacterized protein